MIASLVTRGDVDLGPIIERCSDLRAVHVWDNSQTVDVQVLGRYIIHNIEEYSFKRTFATREPWLVYTQDDDCLIDIATLADLYRPDTVLCNLPAEYRPNYINTPEKLVGFGAIFPHSLIQPTFARYLKIWPFDSVLLREADRIFTGLNHDKIILADVPVTHLPYAEAPDRMYRQADHGAYRVEARRRVLEVLEREGRPWKSS